MCGRYSLTTDQEALAAAMGVEGLLRDGARYNIAPTQEAPVLFLGEGAEDGLVARQHRWGLLPAWIPAPDARPPLINARSETAHRKPSFRTAFRDSRCLVPADGFFEWRKESRGKIPYWIHREDRAPFTFAGLRQRWIGADGRSLDTFAILTAEARGAIRDIHHRMPVILPEGRRQAWLEPAGSIDVLRELLSDAISDDLVVTEVSTHVNAPANDDPRCIAPVGDSGGPPPPEQTSLF